MVCCFFSIFDIGVIDQDMFLFVGSMCFFKVCIDVVFVCYIDVIEYVVNFVGDLFVVFDVYVKNGDFCVFSCQMVCCIFV